MRKIFVSFLTCCCLSAVWAQNVAFRPADQRILKKVTAKGERDVASIAKSFIGTPYKGGTLEGDSVERLRVNLRELDCMTFVESVLAIYRCIQNGDPSFSRFCNILEMIRYRNGVLDGYLSRLHYTSEWLWDNRRKGVLELPSMPHEQPYRPQVSFMSTHCDRYPALKAQPDLCRDIRAIEDSINSLSLHYVPKEDVNRLNDAVQSGDIIAIVTHIKGLDFSHLGFALKQKGVVQLLHASSEAGKVVISQEPLYEYLARHRNHAGIVVARVK